MSYRPKSTLEAGPEQVRYAAILEKGMGVGLLILFITFAIYTLGLMKPYIPLNEVSNYWGMNVHDYLEEAHIQVGWSWLSMLNYGDFINFIGVAILGGVTIICYLVIIPILWENNDKIYAILALLEVVVLSLAASGRLAVGH
jgi:hypothetical protein